MEPLVQTLQSITTEVTNNTNSNSNKYNNNFNNNKMPKCCNHNNL